MAGMHKDKERGGKNLGPEGQQKWLGQGESTQLKTKELWCLVTQFSNHPLLLPALFFDISFSSHFFLDDTLPWFWTSLSLEIIWYLRLLTSQMHFAGHLDAAMWWRKATTGLKIAKNYTHTETTQSRLNHRIPLRGRPSSFVFYGAACIEKQGVFHLLSFKNAFRKRQWNWKIWTPSFHNMRVPIFWR